MNHADALRILSRPGPKTEREALSAGHPITWGAITDGTILEDEPYPWPVFEGLSTLRWAHRG